MNQKSANFYTNSFTLIELLVVIAIIGLLSSIVLVSLQGAKDQAELAEAQSFARQVRASLGLSLVGEWKFDDGNDPTRDSSGYDNHGTLVNNPLWVNGVFGQALEFNGSNNYVHADLIMISQEATACGWLKQASSFSGKKGFIQGSGYDFHLWVNGDGTFNYGAWTTSGNEEFKSTKIHDFNKWTFVCAVNRGGQDATLYVNSDIDESNPLTGDLGGISYFEFARHPGHDDNYFNGAIDEVRIYNSALSFTEIQQLYAQGAANHGIVLK